VDLAVVVLEDYRIAVTQVCPYEVGFVEDLSGLFFAEGWPTWIYYEMAHVFSEVG
jgi:hypothetical protein